MTTAEETRSVLPVRPGLWLLGAIMAGVLTAETLHLPSGIPGLGLMGLAAVAALFNRLRRHTFILLLLAVAGLGLLRHGSVIGAESRGYAALAGMSDSAQRLAVVRGRLESAPRRTATAWSAYLSPGSMVGSGGQELTMPATIAVTIPVKHADLTLSVPGDEIVAIGSLLDLPRERLSSDPQQWHRERGAIGLLRAETLSVNRVSGALPGFLRGSQRIAVAIETILSTRLPRHEAALQMAMMTGSTHLLTQKQSENFRRTGLLHLFSVSGLHTMIVGGMVVMLLRFLGLGVRWRLLALLVVLCFFASLVGLRTAVLRACLLLFLMESRDLLKRPVEPFGALASVAAIFIALWPRVLWQVDFQMTFLCMVAVTAWSPWDNELRQLVGRYFGWNRLGTLVRATTSLLIVSTAIQLLLAPVLLARFGEVSLVAPLANALLLMVATFCVQVGFALFLLTSIVPGAADLYSFFVYPLELLNSGSAWLAGMEWASVEGPSPSVPMACVYTALLLAGPWMRHWSPSQPRRTPWAFAPWVIAQAAVVAVWVLAPARSGHEIHFLDVGQGDATLIRADGHDWLVDAGPPQASMALTRMLRERGVRRLEGIFATHSDADHIGGLPAVLAEFPVGSLYVNGVGVPTGPFALLEDAVRARGLPVYTLRDGASIPLGPDAEAAVLHPTEEFLREGAENNDASLVLRVTMGGTVIMLTGDAEARAEARLLAEGIPLAATVLKAGHHGASTSSSAPFLAAVNPLAVVVSAGRANRFRHPSEETLARFAEAGTFVLRTDQQGSVTLLLQEKRPPRWRVERGTLDSSGAAP